MLLWLGHKSLSGIVEKYLYKNKRKSAFSEPAILLKMIQGKLVARPPLNAYFSINLYYYHDKFQQIKLVTQIIFLINLANIATAQKMLVM